VALEIAEINEVPEYIWQEMFVFFKKSKPFDFCEVRSAQIRDLKISLYLNQIKESSHIYTVSLDGKYVLIFFGDVRQRSFVDFAFGFAPFPPKTMIEAFHKCINQFLIDSNSEVAVAELNRNFKSSSYIKWLKRYDKKCKIVDKQIIWHKNDW
jgi:hypothetical protein